jgi:hypothetical protein
VSRILVSTAIAAPPSLVWADVRDLASHVEWMDDAVAIEFTSPQREGVGTTFTCTTAVGPIRLADRMEVTSWEEGRAIGVRHTGVVEGQGRFTIDPTADGGTLFSWEEELRFPWWLGGRLGAAVGGPVVLRRIWEGNLSHLRRRVEARRAAT